MRGGSSMHVVGPMDVVGLLGRVGCLGRAAAAPTVALGVDERENVVATKRRWRPNLIDGR
jgi:hypothetical protein